MANKKREDKNKPSRKTLRDSEYYNPKTKRYEYRYTDIFGKKRVVSSYRLEPTDQVPKGKRSGLSLREKENEIQELLKDKLDIDGSAITLVELIERQLDSLYCQNEELRYNTKRAHTSALNVVKKHKIGNMQIKKIKIEHCEELLKDMRKIYKTSTIHRYFTVIKRAFDYAVERDYISKNPFAKISIKKTDEKIKALTLEEMNSFLDFCHNDKYGKNNYDLYNILFWTGMRISELCGLTLDDVDLENRTISINKQLQKIGGKRLIGKTKTKSSNRIIPLVDTAYESFKNIIDNRSVKNGEEPCVYDENGNKYSGFVFLTRDCVDTLTKNCVNSYLMIDMNRYNKENSDNPIAYLTPHVCRHTFATNMQILPIKTLQSILGHSDISTTMNTYVDVTSTENQLLEINRLANSLSTKNQ